MDTVRKTMTTVHRSLLLPLVLLSVACGISKVQLIVNVSDFATKRPLPGAVVIVAGTPGHSQFDAKAYADTAGNAYLWVPAGEELVLTVATGDERHSSHQEHLALRHNPEQRTVILH